MKIDFTVEELKIVWYSLIDQVDKCNRKADYEQLEKIEKLLKKLALIKELHKEINKEINT